jgi:hypothetical protein
LSFWKSGLAADTTAGVFVELVSVGCVAWVSGRFDFHNQCPTAATTTNAMMNTANGSPDLRGDAGNGLPFRFVLERLLI